MTDRLQACGIELVSLAVFMMSAVVCTALVEHPGSPVRHAIEASLLRRALIGAGMAVTAAMLIYSRWGQRSGAHMNPSVTLSFLRLGRITGRDAALYLAAQFTGGAVGLVAGVALAGPAAADPAVNYIATVPGAGGPLIAFGAEAIISFGLMYTVLRLSNTPRLARFTGAAAACLVALYITLEAPLSGMSMNPARSLAPALAAGTVGSLWIYFVAPPLGMLAAAELYARRHGLDAVRCAKLQHPDGSCWMGCGAGRKSRSREVEKYRSEVKKWQVEK